MELLEYKNSDDLFDSVARVLRDDLNVTLEKRSRAVAAFAGGTTPAPAFARLAAMDLNWSRVTLIPSDERIVAPDDPRSNLRLLREAFAATGADILPLFDGASDPDAAATLASDRLGPLLPLDLCLLGMGADMHTASLFPHARGTDAALAADAPAVLPVWPETVPEARLTFSAPVLAQAAHVHILIAGPDKMVALRKAAQDGPVADAPVRAVLDRAVVHWAP